MSEPPPTAAPNEYGILLGEGVPVPSEELLNRPIFQGVSESLLRRERGAVVLRKFKAGDIICREGEFGSTAFYILEGKVQVSLSTPIAHVKTQGSSRGFVSKLKSRLVGRQEDKREEETDKRWIPIDAPVDLAYDSPLAEMGAGDLFGEMTCLSSYPRSATVRAVTDCIILEMLSNILNLLKRNPPFKAQLEQTYRSRALNNHLRSSLFAGLPDDVINHLRETAELLSYEPGKVICRQGERADKFFLIRIGFVRVSQTHPGGELVVTYLSRGGYFGELGLLGGGVRTATCTALDHVELVSINAEDFHLLMEKFPAIRRRVEEVAQERQQADQQRFSRIQSTSLNQFLAQGLMEAQSLLVLDLESCTRCDSCVKACAESHDGTTRLVREGLRFDKYLIATSCRQCRDPLCMIGCPVGAIRRRNSLEIIIEDWCIGCGLCAQNCPYGNINMQWFRADDERAGTTGERSNAVVKQKATTCDLCPDHDVPNCVYACPHDAAHRVDPKEFFSKVLDQANRKGLE